MKFLAWGVFVFAAAVSALADDQDDRAGTLVAKGPTLKVPEGFSIELVAGSPLTERPIVAAFDEIGRLYVAESSGSNDPVQTQLEQRPHRIVRLEDVDGDGRFDRRLVFADRMMFPEGVMYLDGSVYVSAPPSIWKLTDTDDDGVADQREEWFQGKTLTGCANDLHGPYLGPDGWMYWCKGAFAEQTHTVHGKPWTTRASHIFRCRADGSGFEPVMTGGMDNPVDVAFTADGERLLSATYFSIPPRVDGIGHAVYGGVYGKLHGVLDGHPRTGALMPVFAPMTPTAPCGLERYNGKSFGPEFANNLFCCQFNLRRVSRHQLRGDGSTYASQDSDFVSSDDVDFHPTDVLVDADGSLLVIDTGGWYKLCCPTSQLWKPDVLGGIYRVRRGDATAVDDPRGLKIDWSSQTAEQLWEMLGDARPVVRHRAERTLVRQKPSSELEVLLGSASKHLARDTNLDGILARVWTLSQIDHELARDTVRQMISHQSEQVRHTALAAASLYRDDKAAESILKCLKDDSPANRRLAAEALGRIGRAEFVPSLLQAAEHADDRVLQHSITYALIEIANPEITRAGLASKSPAVVASALVALDQMPGGKVEASQIVQHLGSRNERLRETARWLVERHADWGDELEGWLRPKLAAISSAHPTQEPDSDEGLESILTAFVSHDSVARLIGQTAQDPKTSAPSRALALRVMAGAKLRETPPTWRESLAAVLVKSDPAMTSQAVAAARSLPNGERSADKLTKALIGIVDRNELPLAVRIDALAAAAPRLKTLSDPQFVLIADVLEESSDAATRAAAVDALVGSKLSQKQLTKLCEMLQTAGPIEINELVSTFDGSTDEHLATKLVDSLKEAGSLHSLRIDGVRKALSKQQPGVLAKVDELELLLNVDAAEQRQRIEELLPKMGQGDVRRGHAVFYNPKAVCSTCHRLGNAGGTIGPDLSKIGEARTERDLLESILYPSLSFVRSYEPVLVITTDGKAINGVIRDETAKEYVIATGPGQEVRLLRDDVEELQPGTVSIMPAGLDKQLTEQELADLVAFLKSTGSTK